MDIKNVLPPIQGWYEVALDYWPNDDEMLYTARRLGQIRPHPNGNLIDLVRPKPKGLSKIPTLSSRHGFDSFPMHTDTAFWSKPARYVIMTSMSISNASTTIINAKNIISSASLNSDYAHAIFLIRTPTMSFYCRLMCKEGGKDLFRYDRNCMLPVNRESKLLINHIESELRKVDVHMITWLRPKLLVFDNWAVLHGRQAVSIEEDRVMKRIYID